MKGRYYMLAASAMLFACALLALQVVGGLEYTKDAELYTRMSMVAVMVSVALLPLFMHAAWSLSKPLCAVLFVGFLAFLAYSLPAQISRTGEIREVKALKKEDSDVIRRKLADLDRTLKWAEPDMMTECHGAPNPLPPRGWPECRRKRGNVAAFTNERNRLQDELRGMGADRIGDLGSETLAWALSPLAAVKPDAIRKGSGLGLPLGLEVSIWALVWLASIAISRASRIEAPTRVASGSTPLRSDPVPQLTHAYSRDEALEDLRVLVKAGQDIPNQEWLQERWRLGSAGTVSKWLSHWQDTGEMPGARQAIGRCKTVVAA